MEQLGKGGTKVRSGIPGGVGKGHMKKILAIVRSTAMVVNCRD